MSFLSEDKKNEIKWWIEDHKSKFYAICGGVVALLLVIIFVIASQFGGDEQIIEAPEEDKFEELDIGGFDKEEHLQKEDDEENVKQEKEYGAKIELMTYTFESNFTYVNTYDYGFIDILINDNMSPYKLYVDSTTFENGVLNDNTYKLMDKYEDIFYLRCKLEDLPEETRLEWEKRDKRNVLNLFRDSKVNKETTNEWNTHLNELKVSKGFTEKDTVETIGEDKWNEIMDEMYTYFETYLLGLENEETGATSPLKEYLKENPYPEYDKVKIAKSPVYLCDIKTRGWDVFTANNLEEYANIYWGAYYSDAEEVYWNEGDIINYQSLKPGKFYKPKKSVNLTIECASPDKDIVVWYRTKDGQTYSKFISKIDIVWENQSEEDGGYYENNNLQISTNVELFGYFVVDEDYDRIFTSKIPFETTNDNGETIVEQKDFYIEEKIEYTRENCLGENITINVSEFLMNDSPYNVDYGIYYIKNDTKETIVLYTEDESSSWTLESNKEVYLDWSIKSFNWRVER